MAPIRENKVRGYLSDPRISSSMRKVYEAALERLGRPGPSLEELSDRANKTMSVLDEKLKNRSWLLGDEHTAVDCVASVWVQWIVWANEHTIAVTPRVLDFLDRSKQRPSWKRSEPKWVISFVRKRIYVASSLVGSIALATLYLFTRKLLFDMI
mmetsp:Transcript_40758/g.85621  ORF Transcript_40758/g.85621 Transcript_40758/m.85621 type:complete len:154 (-) Transcript_40758:40-501(-)